MADATLMATTILDYDSPEIHEILTRLSDGQPEPRAFVQRAHQHLSDVMRPIYSVAETQPCSETVRLNGGSCSQRMAVLEALARAYGVKTRVRAIWLNKAFWKERLPLLQPIMPKTLMPWPQYWLEEKWVDFDELYDTIENLGSHVTHPFTNAGLSLFDAIKTQPVDLLGKSTKFSLQKFVVSEA
ncbi:MAG: transglutaminase domain-containing protein, partial [Bryocella sp.]